MLQGKHNKLYKSIREEEIRFNIFKSNLVKIKEHNIKYENGQSSYSMAITKFADLTEEEFAESFTALQLPENIGTDENNHFSSDSLPTFFDWRTKGVITDVKNEGSACASAWSFDTVS